MADLFDLSLSLPVESIFVSSKCLETGSATMEKVIENVSSDLSEPSQVFFMLNIIFI